MKPKTETPLPGQRLFLAVHENPACRQAAEALRRQGITFTTAYVDDNPAPAHTCDVHTVPALVVGRPEGRPERIRGAEAIADWAEAHRRPARTTATAPVPGRVPDHLAGSTALSATRPAGENHRFNASPFAVTRADAVTPPAAVGNTGINPENPVPVTATRPSESGTRIASVADAPGAPTAGSGFPLPVNRLFPPPMPSDEHPTDPLGTFPPDAR